MSPGSVGYVCAGTENEDVSCVEHSRWNRRDFSPITPAIKNPSPLQMLHYILKRIFNRSYKWNMNVSSISPLFYWSLVNVMCNRCLAFVISKETSNSASTGRDTLRCRLISAGRSHRQPLSYREAQSFSVKILTNGRMMLFILVQRPSCFKHDCPLLMLARRR